MSPLRDLRVVRGRILNVVDIVGRFPIGGPGDPWNAGVANSDDSWIDEFIYGGFRAHGESFLRALEGRFCCCYWDSARNVLFLARDWLGEST